MAALESIGSIKEARVVEARALATTAARLSAHKCLLLGSDPLRWALEAGIAIEHVFVHARHAGDPFVDELANASIPCLLVSDGIARKITDTHYAAPFIGVARIAQELTATDDMGSFVVVLDRVVDHGNLGTIVRSAAAFGVASLVLSDARTDLYFPKVVDASRGAVFTTRVRRTDSAEAAIDELHVRGYQVVATSSYAPRLQAMVPLDHRPVALVVGNESNGVSRTILDRADAVAQIPMIGGIESLNVAVAAGISIYELRFRLVLLMLVQHIRSLFGRELGVTAMAARSALDAQVQHVSTLNATQLVLLMMLKVDAVMLLNDVPRETGTLTEDLDELLAPLLSEDLIAIPANERAVVLTDRGERTLAQLWPVVERADRRALAGFSQAEKEQLRTFLERIRDNCSATIEAADEVSPRPDA